jgi:pyruvate dehydrogenase E2 component (dihydrolipoamide acetyltransferase)
MIEVIVPQVGQDISTAVILEWKKKQGEEVAKGEVIAEVESDKAAFEVEAEADGVLAEILHGEGEEVEVFRPIAYIRLAGESDQTPRQAAAEAAPAASPRAPLERGTAPIQEEHRILASPAARRLARKQDIDLTNIRGTGPGGRIILADIEEAIAACKAADSVPTASDQDTIVPFTRMRRRIADRLTSSNLTIPHFHLTLDVDMTEVMAWRNTVRRRGETILKKHVHLGVVTSVEDGLMVPVIPDADKKGLKAISAITRKNTEAARHGQMNLDYPGTFTVSSLGMFGIRQFTPIINLPQCAILAVGTVEKRVVPFKKEISVRDMMTLTLASDHRAVDGVVASQFLNKIKSDLENLNALISTWIQENPTTDTEGVSRNASSDL